jgi:hypothetical protein
MLGLAMRIAQRMGIHSESACAKRTPFDAEMCRRLWWSLIVFDNRVGELADYKTATLLVTPSWDCKIPLNVNDSDLRPDMKEPPMILTTCTDALFAVVRAEIAEFIRHAVWAHDFAASPVKSILNNSQQLIPSDGEELNTLEKTIDDKYLNSCDPGNPLHSMTIWIARGYLAKCRLVEYYSRYSGSPSLKTEAQRDLAISYALRMLQCDTKIMASPLVKGYNWLAHLYFPLPAYIHIIQDLKQRPISQHAEQAWELMGDHIEARVDFPNESDSPFFNIFTSTLRSIVLQAWEARKTAFAQSGMPLNSPRIVTYFIRKVGQATEQNPGAENRDRFMSMNNMDYSASMPIVFDSESLLYNTGTHDIWTGMAPEVFANVFGSAPLDVDTSNLDWNVLGVGN